MSRVERHAAEEAARNKRSGKRAAAENSIQSTAYEDDGRNGSGDGKRRKKGKLTFFGGLLRLIGSLIMIAAIILSLGLIVPRFAGIQSYVVVSGSMEPEIPVGSMIYSKTVDPATLQPGDIIVFYNTSDELSVGSTDNAQLSDNGDGGEDSIFDKLESRLGGPETGAIPITHRVVENNTETGEIITKGDANAQKDMHPVFYDDVVGKVVLHVPQLGYFLSPLATRMGKIAVVLVLLAGFLLAEVGGRLRK